MSRNAIRLLLALLLSACCLGCASALAEEAEPGVWDLTQADTAELEERFAEAERDTTVRRLLLGGRDEAEDGRMPWAALARLRAARPELEVDYSFRIGHRSFTLDDEVMDLNHRKMEDQGALVRAVTACMPKLRYLDMDFCRVDDEHMAELRDSLPGVEVVWRIWFGDTHHGFHGYSVRTDVDTILASNPGVGGELTPENTVALRYCNKVKYLDLGHNSYLGTLDFCSYMPELEVLIVAMGNFVDLTPLESCPKLWYAEIQTSSLNDLRPLAKLKNLRHINLGYCFALHDITPLYGLDLERLWIGCLTPVPAEQAAEFQRLHPDCRVNTTTVDPTEEGWRYLGHYDWGGAIVDETYERVRGIFRYSASPYSYAYPENDPKYYG